MLIRGAFYYHAQSLLEFQCQLCGVSTPLLILGTMTSLGVKLSHVEYPSVTALLVVDNCLSNLVYLHSTKLFFWIYYKCATFLGLFSLRTMITWNYTPSFAETVPTFL